MKQRKRRRFTSLVVNALCWCAYPVYWLMAEIDERQHRAEEWNVAPPAKPKPTKLCQYCGHGSPLYADYCTYCGTCFNVNSIFAENSDQPRTDSSLIQRRLPFPVPGLEERTVSKPLPVLHMPRTHSAILRALEAAGSPAYDKAHSHPRLLAASVLFPGDTATVPTVRLSGNLSRERDTPPGIQRYGEVSNG